MEWLTADEWGASLTPSHGRRASQNAAKILFDKNSEAVKMNEAFVMGRAQRRRWLIQPGTPWPRGQRGGKRPGAGKKKKV